MTQRANGSIGLIIGIVFGWLAFDPPRARNAGAFSYEPPAAHTGAPGEGVCSSCHFGGAVFDGSLSISAPAEYQPGMNYTITVTLRDPGQMRWGFELVPLRLDETTQQPVMAGTLTNLTAHTTIQEVFDGRQYVSHTSNAIDEGEPDGTYAGTPDGPVSWSFTWTAPPAGSGAVTFYAAGNAANGDGQNGDEDFVYTTSAVSAEGATTAVTSISTTWGKIKMKYR